MKRCVVVGGGLGGLSVAIRLARRGYAVTILEKNDRVGGKADRWEAGGYRFDTGPTLLTMPFVLNELFSFAGRNVNDYLQLLHLDPICRYFWQDGSMLDASPDEAAMERAIRRISPDDSGAYARFMLHAKRVYDAGAEAFLFTPFMSMGAAGILRNAAKFRSVFRIDAFRTMDNAVAQHFKDPRLRQLFNRFATYNGSSPFLAPATLSIIPYVEFTMGGWYIKGGMNRLARVMEMIASDLGVDVRTGAEVERILERNGKAVGVTLTTGENLEAHAVVCNADAVYAREHLLGSDPNGARIRRKPEPSLAGFVLLLGVRKTFPQLDHHNILFSRDYRSEFSSLIDDGRPAEDPTIYLSQSCVHDRDQAPAGCTNLFVLVNAPALSERFNWKQEANRYRELVLDCMTRRGIEFDKDDIEVEKMITPDDFAERYRSYRGSIYGTSSNGRMAAFLRPPNRAREMKNLYFAGGSAHPGGGIPLVLLSGKIVSELVTEDLG